MEPTQEQIRSVIAEVTRELETKGLVPKEAAAEARSNAAASSQPHLEYGNLPVRPGGYGAGFAGSYGVGPGSPGSGAHVARWGSARAAVADGKSRERNLGPRQARGIFTDLEAAVRAAEQAHKQLVALPLLTRAAAIENVRRKLRDNVELLAQLAKSETGMGRVEDKIQKNLLVINQTPGIEDLEPHVFTGDHGLTLTEWAPYGVIGAAGPSTNPSETIINNGIGMMAGGNAIVFAVHPSAKGVCQTTISLFNEAVVEAGGPENMIATIAEPTIESAQAMMRHPKTRLLVVTGGPGVVKEAMASGKKVIAAGPGNPPVVVDETADLIAAGRDIVRGASLDNNVICTDEKEVFVVERAADALKASMLKHGAYEVTGPKIDELRKLVLEKDNGARKHSVTNRKLVGRDAAVILKQIGIEVGPEIRLVIAEVPPDHPFIWTELLMPVMGVARVESAEKAMEWAVAAEHGFRHTASIYSKNVEHLSRMARMMDCSIFIKNAPNYAGLGMGGEGPTSFTIASPTGEGMTTARSFTRKRRCVLVDYFRIV
ncbi:MAG TPA: aldehyde dehydrogenase family protein [Candidatus Eisenbacteria bacterium]|nr:aldehyde dehydrogenase family protein [Candidatus Eisenbacteria bacterium]